MTESRHFAVLESAGKHFEIGTEPVRIGRGGASTHTLLDSMMSREHAEILYQDGTFFITDLDSTHGTWVDGKRVQRAPLADGTHILLGTTEFTFRLEQDAVVTKMLPDESVSFEPVPSGTTHEERPDGPAAEESEEQPAAKPKKRRLFIGCLAVIGAVICIAVTAFGIVVAKGVMENLAAEEGFSSSQSQAYTAEDLSLALEIELEDERPQILANLGLPDEFDIAIVEVDGGEVRRESWYYYGYGMRIDFVDGVVLWTVELDPAPENTFFPAWYDPTDFEIGMTPDAAAAVLVEVSPAGTAPETIDLSEGGDDLEGGVMLLGDQIILGFEQGRLVYVETVGVVVGQEVVQ